MQRKFLNLSMGTNWFQNSNMASSKENQLWLIYWSASMTAAVDKKETMDFIFLDFSKAFDRVPRQRLFHKLEHCGFRGRLLHWMKSFLSDRYFCMRVGCSFSTDRFVRSGVPPGSVLGPLRFILYTNDLVRHILSNCAFYRRI